MSTELQTAKRTHSTQNKNIPKDSKKALCYWLTAVFIQLYLLYFMICLDGSKFCSNCGKEIVVVAEYTSTDLPSFSKVKKKEVNSATKVL